MFHWVCQAMGYNSSHMKKIGQGMIWTRPGFECYHLSMLPMLPRIGTPGPTLDQKDFHHQVLYFSTHICNFTSPDQLQLVHPEPTAHSTEAPETCCSAPRICLRMLEPHCSSVSSVAALEGQWRRSLQRSPHHMRMAGSKRLPRGSHLFTYWGKSASQCQDFVEYPTLNQSWQQH